MKDVLILRTHKFNEHIARELRRLQQAGLSVVVVADERQGLLETTGFLKASLTAQSLEQLGLAPHSKAGWLCGDYALYLGAQSIPDADRYWLMDRDVRINFDEPSEFFSSFSDVDADFLGVRHEPAPAKWYWRQRMEPHRSSIYQTLFGIVRVSRRALSHLLPIRQGLRDLPEDECPNDESFVASVLASDGFLCGSFRDHRDFFPSRSFALKRVVSGTLIDEGLRDNLVHHSVLYGEDFAAKALQIARRFPSINKVQDLLAGARVELSPDRAAEFAEQLVAAA